MKKTLCIILSAVLIISACIFSVNAVTVPQIDTSPSIDMPEFVYCEEGFNILYQFDDPSGITRTFCYLCSGQNPDGSNFTLLADYGGSVYCGDAVKYYELDGYTLVSPREYLPGYYYILADGKMSELSYAYEHEMFDSDALYEQLIKCDDKPGVWSKNANLIVTSPRVSSITFTDNFGWGQMYVYAWDSDGKSIDGAYPGSPITNKKINSYGETQFVYNLPENAAGIIIGNGTDSRSEEITDFSRYDGYWFSGKQNGDGHYVLTGYIVSEEPTLDPNATEPTYKDLPQPVDGNYAKEFVNWSLSKYGEDCLDDGYSYNELYTHYDGEQPDWVLCQARHGIWTSPMITWLRIGGIGGRTVINNNWDHPFMSGYGVYDVNADKFYGLEELTEDCFMPKYTGLSADNYDGLTEALAELNIGYVTGDANKDNKVDILDAALIQKVASGKANIDFNDRYVLDINSDNTVDILDASIIQKALVAE